MKPRRTAVVLLCVPALLAAPALAGPVAATSSPPTGGSVAGFAYGEVQPTTVGQAGCGSNVDGEPSLHVSRAGLVGLGSERGIGSGSDYWRAKAPGGSGASACALVYSGQPNATSGTGASGGDIDTAFAPVADPTTHTYRIYVASLNLGSIDVATSTNDGATFTTVPVQGGVPGDDREWIAAYGPATSLLSYHDVGTGNIDILRSTTGGAPYTQVSTAIPPTDYKATNNELGNLVIDHNATPPTPGGFWAYQTFVAPSTNPGTGTLPYNEAFLAVSSDGGTTWTDRPIPCSTSFGDAGLNHNFPNASVAPNGTLWYAVSNNTGVYLAHSFDHGATWTCTGQVSTPAQAIFPWVVATSRGVDLVYYGTSGGAPATETWYVYFAQRTSGGFTTSRLMPVHLGPVCEGGVSCTGGRQLLDDFAVDTDPSGWAHIAYSHDSPNLGGSGSYTGYAVQRSGTRVGAPN